MSNYVIITDSSCDIPPDVLRAWDVSACQLCFTFEGDEHTYLNKDMKPSVFFGRMRSGETAHTSAVNVDAFYNAFKECLEKGNDVLCLAVSSALSGTCRFAELAAEDLAQEFPGRRIRVIDSRSASAGLGLLVYLVSELKRSGASLDEASDYAESVRNRVCHWFTVDDLNYLKRGGRVSPTVAVIGQVLQVKPVLRVDDDGFLVPVSKVRGRKASVLALAEQFFSSAPDYPGPFFIVHGDCMKDAELLENMIRSKVGENTDIRIFDVGPVIGSHSGPGTLALFFLADRR